MPHYFFRDYSPELRSVRNLNTPQTSVDDGANSVGACTSHADRCGAGTGMFLRVRECKLVLLAGRGAKGCFIPSPYVDQVWWNK